MGLATTSALVVLYGMKDDKDVNKLVNVVVAGRELLALADAEIVDWLKGAVAVVIGQKSTDVQAKALAPLAK